MDEYDTLFSCISNTDRKIYLIKQRLKRARTHTFHAHKTPSILFKILSRMKYVTNDSEINNRCENAETENV